MDVDAEIAAAKKRVYRLIDRKLHFAQRSDGQRKRREREKNAAICEHFHVKQS